MSQILQDFTLETLTEQPRRKAGRPSNTERQQLADGRSMLETMMQLYEEGGSDKEVMKLLRILPKDFEIHVEETPISA